MNESIFQQPDSYVGNKGDHYVSESLMIENVVYASRHNWGRVLNIKERVVRRRNSTESTENTL